VSKVLKPIAEDFDNFAATPSDFISEGNRVASFGVYTGHAKSAGTWLNAPFVHLWTVENGRLRTFKQFTDSGAWHAALGAN
jgi:hypothetical protein